MVKIYENVGLYLLKAADHLKFTLHHVHNLLILWKLIGLSIICSFNINVLLPPPKLVFEKYNFTVNQNRLKHNHIS